MIRHRLGLLLAAGCLALASTVAPTVGCSDSGSSPEGPDASMADSEVDMDAAPDDGATPDAAVDGGIEPDAGPPLPGWGDISGSCEVLDDQEWSSSAPFIFRNAIDFGATGFDEGALTPGGNEIWVDGNLGGSSIHSEIIAYELLHRCELASLLKTEGEIVYKDPDGKKTDILVEIDSRKIGVSVTRAFHYPPEDPYTVQEATNLLTDKLGDVLLSAQNADPADEWQRSVLHVVAYDPTYADAIETAFSSLDATVTADTIVFVTVTNGEDAFAY